MAEVLRLVCRICRWRPPDDMEMSIVVAHFDLEPDHDATDIKLELVAVCDRCDLEMPMDRIEPLRDGGSRHRFTCTRCHRSKAVVQREGDEQ